MNSTYYLIVTDLEDPADTLHTALTDRRRTELLFTDCTHATEHLAVLRKDINARVVAVDMTLRERRPLEA